MFDVATREAGYAGAVGARSARGRRPPLTGREAELAALRQVVLDTRPGGRIAVVEGAAGIGKTRLLEAVIDDARRAGLDVRWARATEFEAHRPLSAIAGWDPGARSDTPAVADTRELPVAEGILAMLGRHGARRVVLVLEDLQWADRSSLAVLARVATAIDRLPVRLLVSERPEPRRTELDRLLAVLASRAATWIRLDPLDEPSSAALLEGVLGEPAGPRLVGQVRRAGGNPLFLCELVAALQADGTIQSQDGCLELAGDTGQPSLPLTILHRLSFLTAEVLDLLGLASVFGTTFPVKDLALLAHRPVAELVPALQSARRAGVLGERCDQLAFRHELVRDTLYDDMPQPVLRSLHGEVARLLADAGEPIERRVEHEVRATAPGDQRAVATLVDTAGELVERNPRAAVDLYRRAIELSTVPDTLRAELLPELAEALVSAGLLEDGEAACREAIDRDAAPDRAGRLRLSLMSVLTRRERPAEAAREGAAGLADPRIGGCERKRLEARVAMARVLSGAIDPAERTARDLLRNCHDEVARVVATNTLAIAAVDRGKFAAAAELAAPIVRWTHRARAAHDTLLPVILGAMPIGLDRLDQAAMTIQRGRRLTESLGMTDAVAAYRFQAGYVAYLGGQLDDALAELGEHTEPLDHARGGWPAAHGVRALIALHRGDVTAAASHVAAGERDVTSGAAPHGSELIALARTRLLAAGGDEPAALDTIAGAVDRLLDAGTSTYLPLLGPELVRRAAAAGRPGCATGVVDELGRIATLNPGVRSLAAVALQTRGLIDADARALAAAVELMRGTGRELETARVAEDAAGVGCAAAGDLLDLARRTYARCGATRDLARVDAALRGLGVRRGARGHRQRPTTGWEALTEAELNVVRLVAEHLTNAEIGAQLFVSRRTVQTHVSHALAKVGVATRRELATAATRRTGGSSLVADLDAIRLVR